MDFFEKPQHQNILDSFELPNFFFKNWGFEQKKESQYLASMGIYIFKRQALVRLLEEDKREDFGKHLIPSEIQRGKTYAFVYKGYWEDIGTISSYYEANLALTRTNFGLDTYNEEKPIFARSTFLPGPQKFEEPISQTRFFPRVW